MAIPFNMRDPMMKARARAHTLSVDYNFACACDEFRMPIWTQCRLLLADGAAEGDDRLPPAMLPYPLMFYNAEFLEGMTSGHSGDMDINALEEYNSQPCGPWATFDPDAGGCKTIIIPGYTPSPPLPPAMFTQAPPQYPQAKYDGEKGFVTDPYACEVGLEIDFYFESPVAWENPFVESLGNLYYAQTSLLVCLCDQLDNPILNSCKQGSEDSFPIEQNYIEPEPEKTRRWAGESGTKRAAPAPQTRFGRRLTVDSESENMSTDAVRVALKKVQASAAAARSKSERSGRLAARTMAMVDRMGPSL